METELARAFSSNAHLECLALDAVWLIHEYIRAPAHSNLPRSFIEGYRFELIRVIDVYRLEERLRTAEDDQRVAGDVRL